MRKKAGFAGPPGLGGRESSVHRGNKPGEGEVKRSAHRVRPSQGGESLCCVHSRMHALIHTFIHLQGFIRGLGGGSSEAAQMHKAS